MSPKWLRSTWLPGAILLALLIGIAFRNSESHRFAVILVHAQPMWLAVGAVLQIATYFCTALIFKLGLRRSGTPVRLRSLVPLGLVKLFIDQVVPTAGIGGTVLIVRALERRRVPVGVSTAVVVVSLLGFYAAYALAVAICLGNLWFRTGGRTSVLSLVTIASLLTASVPVTILWLTRGGFRVVPQWMRRLPGLAPVLEAMAAAPSKTLHDRRLLLAAATLQFTIFALDAATLRAMLLALGSNAGIATVFTSFVLASVAATLTLLPGGVGPFEAGSVASLHLLGVPLDVSVASTLLLRGLTLWLPMIPGLWLARREMVRTTD